MMISYFAASPSEVLCDFVSHKPCRSVRDIGVSVGQIIVLKQISTLRLEMNTTACVADGALVSNRGLFEIRGCPLNGSNNIIRKLALRSVFGMLARFLPL